MSYNPSYLEVRAARSDNLGSLWAPVVTVGVGTGPDPATIDKPHLWIDNRTVAGNLYAAWKTSAGRIMAANSPAGGTGWSGAATISAVNQVESQNARDNGVNLQTGPNGHVYACWSTYFTSGNIQVTDESRLGFNKFDGTNWGQPVYITSVGGPQPVALTVNGTLKSKLSDVCKYPESTDPNISTHPVGMGPSMTVDQVSGAIYLAWHNKGAPCVNCGLPESSNVDVYVMKSTDEGATWGLPMRVNTDNLTGHDHWFPWITWDDATGMLAVIFYDSRNHDPLAAHDHTADVYVAVTSDYGGPWTNFKVSDPVSAYSASFNPGNDYVGIAARDGKAIPVWADDRTRLTPSDCTHLAKTPHAVYTSSFSLWDIDPPSVSASVVGDPGESMTVSASWATTVAAPAGDYIVLYPPGSGTLTSPACTTCGSGGIHTMSFTTPCLLGNWYYAVRSTPRVGFTTRTSNKHFLVKITNCIE